MNALYVTVSIPLLLVLAGFNHAHGLTTFGKTQNQPTTPVIPGTNTLFKIFFNNAQSPKNSFESHICTKKISLFLCINIRFRFEGKPCGNHTSCRAIQGTSCVPEPRDSSRKSCLCGDNQPPKNGACSAELKGIDFRHL